MKREVKRLWNCKEVVLVPITIGALVTVSKIFHPYLQKAGLDDSTQPLEKAELVLVLILSMSFCGQHVLDNRRI